MQRQILTLISLTTVIFLVSCGGSDTDTGTETEHTGTPTPAESSPELPQVSQVDDPSAEVESPMQAETPVIPEIPSISLSGSGEQASSSEEMTAGKESTAADEKRRQLLEVMKPVQIMLGAWKGTTQKEVGDFKALTNPEWVWDFKTNRDQPAMVMKSDKSPYFKDARLSYLTDKELFVMTATDADGNVREFEGTFAKPAEEFQGDDQKMHIKYQLQLRQTNGKSARNTWQVTFNQQDNHRYLVELARKSGSNFLRFDTIATQREGTSFAKSDLGYGERECIISGGLGTSQVSYKGKNYWVCCSGCRAAFDEDPESWIAEYQAKVAAKEGS